MWLATTRLSFDLLFSGVISAFTAAFSKTSALFKRGTLYISPHLYLCKGFDLNDDNRGHLYFHMVLSSFCFLLLFGILMDLQILLHVSNYKRQLSVSMFGSSSRLRLWPDFKSEHMYGLPMRAGCLEKS